MEIANRETYGLLAVVLLLLTRQYPVKKPYHTLKEIELMGVVENFQNSLK